MSAPTTGPDYVTQTLVQAGRRHDTTVADPETVWLTPTPYPAAGCGDTTGGSDLDVNAKLKLTESENVHRYNIWIIANVVSGDDIRTLVIPLPVGMAGWRWTLVLSTMRLPGNLRRSRSTAPQELPA